MIRGIMPLGERIRNLDLKASSSHIVGGLLGAGMTVTLLWLVAVPVRTLLPRTFGVVLICMVAVAAIGRDVGWLHFDGRQTQVPQRWNAAHGTTKAYGLYGAVLGSAIFTHVPFGLAYVVIGIGALQRSVLVAFGVGAFLGFGRTATVPLGAVSRRFHDLATCGFASARRRLRLVSAAVTTMVILTVVLAQ